MHLLPFRLQISASDQILLHCMHGLNDLHFILNAKQREKRNNYVGQLIENGFVNCYDAKIMSFRLSTGQYTNQPVLKV